MWDARQAHEPVDEIPAIATAYRTARAELRHQCPDGYTGQFAADIDRMLLYLLRFLDLRLNETQKFGGDARKYLRQLKKGEDKPLEKELGRDLRDFLRGQGLRVDLEVSNVGGGRVDIAWRPRDELITLELKRDWKTPTWDAYANAFLAQATSYQVNGPPVNFLVVLDLTDKPAGLAAVPACVHVRTVPGPAGDPRRRTVIMLRIPKPSTPAPSNPGSGLQDRTLRRWPVLGRHAGTWHTTPALMDQFQGPLPGLTALIWAGRDGAGQPWSGPGCGGFVTGSVVTSPIRSAAAALASAWMSTFGPTACPS
jgi:hypothetical protein